MRIRDVIEAFANKESTGCTSGSVHYVAPSRLYSYSTVIAQWIDDTIVINLTYYSNATSKHRNMLINLLTDFYKIPIIELIDVPVNVQNLTDYMHKRINKPTLLYY